MTQRIIGLCNEDRCNKIKVKGTNGVNTLLVVKNTTKYNTLQNLLLKIEYSNVETCIETNIE